LFSSWYHKSLGVSDEDSPPNIKAKNTKINIEYLLLINKFIFF
jgi:hypothetical protein